MEKVFQLQQMSEGGLFLQGRGTATASGEVALKPRREWEQPRQRGLAEKGSTGQAVMSLLAGAD